MSTLLVTISGPDAKVDLAVSGETPIEELMPTFLEMAAPTAGNGSSTDWAIGPPGRATLPGNRTLADCGVTDGALLSLRRPAAEKPVAEEFPAAPAPAPGPGSPLERARRSLPRRIGAFERLRDAGRAAMGSKAHLDGPTANAAEPLPRPSAVTVARPTTPFERARAAWRRTDYERRLDAAIVAPRLRRCATIAVVSPKGGVGKTTTTALIGSLLAHTRRDRIVAVDTNPDYGSLGPTLTPDHEVFVDDLLDLLDHPELTVTQLDANLGRSPDGLMVLPAPTDPARMSRLDRRAYIRVIEHLQTKAGILLLDCGTGLQDPPAQAAIMSADQIVLVSDAEPATATLVAQAAKRLLRSGAPLMLVVNKLPRRGARLDLEELAKLVPDASGMATVESDPRAAARVAAGEFTWSDPSGPWPITLRELTSALLSQWPSLGLTASEPATAPERPS